MRIVAWASAFVLACVYRAQADIVWNIDVTRSVELNEVARPLPVYGVMCKSEHQMAVYLRQRAVWLGKQGEKLREEIPIWFANIVTRDPQACSYREEYYIGVPEEVGKTAKPKQHVTFITYRIQIVKRSVDAALHHEYKDPYPIYRYIFRERREQ